MKTWHGMLWLGVLGALGGNAQAAPECWNFDPSADPAHPPREVDILSIGALRQVAFLLENDDWPEPSQKTAEACVLVFRHGAINRLRGNVSRVQGSLATLHVKGEWEPALGDVVWFRLELSILGSHTYAIRVVESAERECPKVRPPTERRPMAVDLYVKDSHSAEIFPDCHRYKAPGETSGYCVYVGGKYMNRLSKVTLSDFEAERVRRRVDDLDIYLLPVKSSAPEDLLAYRLHFPRPILSFIAGPPLVSGVTSGGDSAAKALLENGKLHVYSERDLWIEDGAGLEVLGNRRVHWLGGGGASGECVASSTKAATSTHAKDLACVRSTETELQGCRWSREIFLDWQPPRLARKHCTSCDENYPRRCAKCCSRGDSSKPTAECGDDLNGPGLFGYFCELLRKNVDPSFDIVRYCNPGRHSGMLEIGRRRIPLDIEIPVAAWLPPLAVLMGLLMGFLLPRFGAQLRSIEQRIDRVRRVLLCRPLGPGLEGWVAARRQAATLEWGGFLLRILVLLLLAAGVSASVWGQHRCMVACVVGGGVFLGAAPMVFGGLRLSMLVRVLAFALLGVIFGGLFDIIFRSEPFGLIFFGGLFLVDSFVEVLLVYCPPARLMFDGAYGVVLDRLLDRLEKDPAKFSAACRGTAGEMVRRHLENGRQPDVAELCVIIDVLIDEDEACLSSLTTSSRGAWKVLLPRGLGAGLLYLDPELFETTPGLKVERGGRRGAVARWLRESPGLPSAEWAMSVRNALARLVVACPRAIVERKVTVRTVAGQYERRYGVVLRPGFYRIAGREGRWIPVEAVRAETTRLPLARSLDSVVAMLSAMVSLLLLAGSAYAKVTDVIDGLDLVVLFGAPFAAGALGNLSETLHPKIAEVIGLAKKGVGQTKPG